LVFLRSKFIGLFEMSEEEYQPLTSINYAQKQEVKKPRNIKLLIWQIIIVIAVAIAGFLFLF
jgi:hypothetical protein